MMKSLLTIASLAVISLLTASPAFAGKTVPVPLLAAGAPALALFAGGYYLIRRRWRG
jgi:lipopolysaccharide export LptBFGC system permease protein LptF